MGPFKGKGSLQSEGGPFDTASSMQHPRNYNNDIPLSRGPRDGARLADAQSRSKETFHVAPDEVRTLDIQDPGLYGSGYLKANRMASIEDAGTHSSQTLPMAGQSSDPNLRMQIRLTKQQ